MQGSQFKLDLHVDSNKNSFRNSLKNGEFNILFQINVPEIDCNPDTIFNRCDPFIKTVEKIRKLNCGIAVLNGKRHQNPLNVIEFASQLEFSDINKNVFFVSGRNNTEKYIYETVEAALRTGIKNIVPVSGDFLPADEYGNLKNVNFYESVRSLKLINKYFNEMEIFSGTVLNPFKYTPLDLYPQYFKLMKKIKLGANYIFTQTGWDLLKLQELRWYLEKRNFFMPSIAKFYFLNPDYVEDIISGKLPGVRISPDFLSILRKESNVGFTQFMSAQWRKLQLMLTGLKFIGYSGVLIEGLESSSDVNVAQIKIKEAFNEFSSFEDWKNAYSEYLARAEMAPYPYRFYMYRNLFKEAYADNAREKNVKIPDCTAKEKLKYKFSEFLWKGKTGKNGKISLKKLIFRCADCREEKCILQNLFYVCYKKCPKKMVNGPCGDTKADGSCHIMKRNCIFGKIFRLANWRKAINFLEEDIL
ncbi:MAG: methylenetetrahydrofolate reductase C-terminal domain-containing protein [Victivallales bacterium]|nr:methylenetetrahydrofolate reductase C-terminal domain-containing protein [Victivallales bacterium]